jgi:hypothetical protein
MRAFAFWMSVATFVLMAKDRYWPGVILFAILIPAAISVAVMGITGPSFSQGLHAVIDLCGLNVYLIVVPRYRSWYRLKHAAQPN